MSKKRCFWVSEDALYVDYHDREWGVPVFDDRTLFEFLVLEGMQAGLSWLTILRKRENYRRCFDNFDASVISQYKQREINSLLKNEGIVRNKLKVNSVVINAKLFLETVDEWGSFAEYIWHFVDHHPIQNHWKNAREVPAFSKISDVMSKDLKKRGYKFVGSTICHAFMQAVGMVNDHTIECFRHREVAKLCKNKQK